MDLGVWGCPVCGSRLRSDGGDLVCAQEGHRFPRRGDLPVLLRPEDHPLLGDSESYAEAWKRDTFAPPPGRATDLPYIRGGGWPQKARSLELLVRILGPARRRTVADVGAGTGWLSYRLSEAGFRCFAADISADPAVGLGAAAAYDATPHRFDRAIASLTRWPFLDRTIDVAICNASLHYLDDVRPTISEAARVISRDGLFVVMNDPVHEDPRSASRAGTEFKERMRRHGGHGALIDGHRHFVASEIEAALRERFPGGVERHDPDFGFAFRTVRALKAVLIGFELASFPIYVARP